MTPLDDDADSQSFGQLRHDGVLVERSRRHDSVVLQVKGDEDRIRIRLGVDRRSSVNNDIVVSGVVPAVNNDVNNDVVESGVVPADSDILA